MNLKAGNEQIDEFYLMSTTRHLILILYSPTLLRTLALQSGQGTLDS